MLISAGCGGSTKDSDTAHTRSPKRHAVRVVPQSADLVARVTVSAADLTATRAVLRRVPIWGLADRYVNSRQSIVTSIVGTRDAAALRGADEWLGQHMGVARVPVDARHRGWLVWCESTDPRRAIRAVRGGLEAARAGEHHGTEMYVGRRGSRKVWIADVHGTVVGATSREVLSASIDAASAGALEATPEFRTAMKLRRSSGQVVSIWVPRVRLDRWVSGLRQSGSSGVVIGVGVDDHGVWGSLRAAVVRAQVVRSGDLARVLDASLGALIRMIGVTPTEPCVAIGTQRGDRAAWPRVPGVQASPAVTQHANARPSQSADWWIQLVADACVRSVIEQWDPRAGVVADQQLRHVGTPEITGRYITRDASTVLTARMSVPLSR